MKWRHAAAPLLAAALGCGQQDVGGEPEQPPTGLPYATASNDCAPWDGHAVTVLMSNQPGTDSGGIDAGQRPLVRVSFYPRAAVLGGEQFRWPADPAEATAVRCIGTLPCEPAIGGTVSVANALPDSVVRGAVVLHFGDGSVTAGAFRARWIPRQILCG